MENQDNLKKKVFTRETKENYISLWQSGEKSKMKFATENGIKYYTFVNWCDTLLPKNKKEPSGFTEVKLPVQKTTRYDGFAIRLFFTCGFSIRTSKFVRFLTNGGLYYASGYDSR